MNPLDSYSTHKMPGEKTNEKIVLHSNQLFLRLIKLSKSGWLCFWESPSTIGYIRQGMILSNLSFGHNKRTTLASV